MSLDNPLPDAVEGTTRAVLEWSSEKIASLVQSLKERKLAFIKEPSTIEVVKEQYRSGEAKFYARYIDDNKLLLLVRMGLTLRRLENDEDRLLNLRNKIHEKFGTSGLHIAQFVQNGILNRYFGLCIEKLTSEQDLKKQVCRILENIEQYALFVSSTSKVADIVRKTTTILDAHSPPFFVIAGLKSASPIVADSVLSLGPLMEDYNLERVSSFEKEILFFTRKDG